VRNDGGNQVNGILGLLVMVMGVMFFAVPLYLVSENFSDLKIRL